MKLFHRLFSHENLLALLLALLIIGMLVFSVDDAPQWIYQGF